MAASRERIDVLLVRGGYASSRSLAQALLMEGRVRVSGRRVEKPGSLVDAEAVIEVAGPPRPFVSRAGGKLDAALDAFGIDVNGWTALDVGAGTGGFTDCLLKRGAAAVFAVDVGHGQIDQTLRADPRVTVFERINARFLEPSDLPGPVDIAVMDVSFISATLILPRIPPLLRGGDLVLLVKPQFEVGRGEVGRGGIVRDPEGWRRALRNVVDGAAAGSMTPRGIIVSPIAGAEGNREFLLHLTLARPERSAGEAGVPPDPGSLIEAAVASAAAPAAASP